MSISGLWISLLTFPGVIVHEAAHVVFCKTQDVRVLKVCYFRLGNPAGYVIHVEPQDFISSFLVSLGPLFWNSLLCVLVCFPVAARFRVPAQRDFTVCFLMWLGISIGIHALPSTADARNLFRAAKKAIGSFHPLAIRSFPLVILIVLVNRFGIFYGIALGMLGPALLHKYLG
jgi:hypothetical protein